MFLGRDGFVWWIGVVEDNEDPLLLGRARVRIFGYHPKYVDQTTTVGDVNNLVPTGDLPWATIIISPNTSTLYSRPELGDFVLGFFLDGVEAQEPAIFGVIPTPLKDGAISRKFGKHAKSTRSYEILTKSGNDYPPNNANDRDYQKLLKNKFIRSEEGHYFGMRDHPDNNEIGVWHKDGLYIKIKKDEIELIGRGTAKIILKDNDIYVEGAKGSYNLVDQLDWISKTRHTTSGGSKRGPRTYQIGTRLEPGTPGDSGGGGGGGCFSGETRVIMWNGSEKRIDEIEIGELVQSGIATQFGKVVFIEKLPNNIQWKELYSPSPEHEPFATPNHMLFENGEWVALDTDKYDWMPKTKRVQYPITKETDGDFVYNLWLEGGDGTYYVNGYLTHSIMYDGGFMRLAWEKGYLTHEQVTHLMYEFTSQDKSLTYGAYLINKLVGKINLDIWIKLISYIMKQNKEHFLRKFIILSMKGASFIMRCFNKAKETLWREKSQMKKSNNGLEVYLKMKEKT